MSDTPPPAADILPPAEMAVPAPEEPVAPLHDTLTRRAQRVLGTSAPANTPTSVRSIAAAAGSKIKALVDSTSAKTAASPQPAPADPAPPAPAVTAPAATPIAPTLSFNILADDLLRSLPAHQTNGGASSSLTLDMQLRSYYYTDKGNTPRERAATVFRKMYDDNNLFMLEHPALISAWAEHNHFATAEGVEFWHFLDKDVRHEQRLSGNAGLLGYMKAVKRQCTDGPLSGLIGRLKP